MNVPAGGKERTRVRSLEDSRGTLCPLGDDQTRVEFVGPRLTTEFQAMTFKKGKSGMVD